MQFQRVWDSARLTDSQGWSLSGGPQFEWRSAYFTCGHVGKCKLRKPEASDTFASRGMRECLNHMKSPMERQSCKHGISSSGGLTWKECSRERAGSESSRAGIQVQTWFWKFCPRSFLHCSACIHLGRMGKKERKKETKMNEAKKKKKKSEKNPTRNVSFATCHLLTGTSNHLAINSEIRTQVSNTI